jgi:hypothetical protein
MSTKESFRLLPLSETEMTLLGISMGVPHSVFERNEQIRQRGAAA